ADGTTDTFRQSEIQVIDLLPGLGRDNFTRGPGILAHHGSAIDDRGRIAPVGEQETYHLLLFNAFVLLFVGFVPTGDVHQDAPADMRTTRQVQQQGRVDIDQKRGVL